MTPSRGRENSDAWLSLLELSIGELRAALVTARGDDAGREAALHGAVALCRELGAAGRADRLEALLAG